MTKRVALRYAYLTIFMLLCACSPSDPAKDKLSPPPEQETLRTASTGPESQQINKLSLQLASRAELAFTQLEAQCQQLTNRIKNFINNKTRKALKQAHQSWQDCHNSYVSTRFYRSLSTQLNLKHPDLNIDFNAEDRNDNNTQHSNSIRLDQYPILPGYLDSVDGYPYSGLIHSDIEISAESLNNEHQLGDSAYVAMGFHALEFMLAGEHNNLDERLKSFTASGNKELTRASKRREQYLITLGETLLKDIQMLTRAWQEGGLFFNQLQQVPKNRLAQATKDQADVELSAISTLRQMSTSNPERPIHDTKTTLTQREQLANELKSLLKLSQ